VETKKLWRKKTSSEGERSEPNAPMEISNIVGGGKGRGFRLFFGLKKEKT